MPAAIVLTDASAILANAVCSSEALFRQQDEQKRCACEGNGEVDEHGVDGVYFVSLLITTRPCWLQGLVVFTV